MTASRFPADHVGLTTDNRDALLEAFTAELTVVAYRVALRATRQGAWLDLQLDLWRALADTVQTWGKELSAAPAADDAAAAVRRRRLP